MLKSGGKIFAIAALLAANTLCAGNAAADAVEFVLREYNGKIALFCENEEEPAAIYKTPIDELFPADKKLLQNGISFNSREELLRLIEDLNLR